MLDVLLNLDEALTPDLLRDFVDRAPDNRRAEVVRAVSKFLA